MWDNIKQWPTSVKLATVFLAIVWCLFLTLCPLATIGLTVVILTIISVVRVIQYFLDGR